MGHSRRLSCCNHTSNHGPHVLFIFLHGEVAMPYGASNPIATPLAGSPFVSDTGSMTGTAAKAATGTMVGTAPWTLGEADATPRAGPPLPSPWGKLWAVS